MNKFKLYFNDGHEEYGDVILMNPLNPNMSFNGFKADCKWSLKNEQIEPNMSRMKKFNFLVKHLTEKLGYEVATFDELNVEDI